MGRKKIETGDEQEERFLASLKGNADADAEAGAGTEAEAKAEAEAEAGAGAGTEAGAEAGTEAESEDGPRVIVITTETRKLQVPMSLEQKARIGQELADKVHEIELIEFEKEVANKSFNRRIKMAAKELQDLSKRFNAGGDLAPVECRVERDHTGGYVVVRRLDTQEVIEDRLMRDDELQLPIPEPVAEPKPEAEYHGDPAVETNLFQDELQDEHQFEVPRYLTGESVEDSA